MAYDDLNNTHNPATSTIAPASWGDQVRDNFEFLVEPPICVVSASSPKSVATASWTALDADTEQDDSDGMHSTVTNTSRITVVTAGRYEFGAMVEFAGSTGGTLRAVRFLVNGTTIYDGANLPHVNNAALRTVVPANRRIPLDAGDYVEVQAFQNTGGALNVTLIEFSAKFETRR